MVTGLSSLNRFEWIKYIYILLIRVVTRIFRLLVFNQETFLLSKINTNITSLVKYNLNINKIFIKLKLKGEYLWKNS